MICSVPNLPVHLKCQNSMQQVVALPYAWHCIIFQCTRAACFLSQLTTTLLLFPYFIMVPFNLDKLGQTHMLTVALAGTLNTCQKHLHLVGIIVCTTLVVPYYHTSNPAVVLLHNNITATACCLWSRPRRAVHVSSQDQTYPARR